MSKSDAESAMPLEKNKKKEVSDAVNFKDSHSNNISQDWPYDNIIPISTDVSCPVVHDTSIQRSFTPASLRTSKMTTGDSRLTESLPQPLSQSNLNKNAEDFEESASISQTTASSLSTTSSSQNTDSVSAMLSSSHSEDPNREVLLLLMMKDREDEFTQLYKYSIYCATWNVNDQSGIPALQEWLTPSKRDAPPDVYAIGLQEMDLSKNMLVSSNSPKQLDWLTKTRAALHPKAQYVMLKKIQLVGMFMVVFVKEGVKEAITELECGSAGTGLLGMMGNKGAVVVRFKLRQTSVCIVNCHLAAHTEELERRNQDYNDINSKLSFSLHNRNINISEHDVVLWLGDLNYRLSEIDSNHVKKHIRHRAWPDLINFDQLTRQRMLKKAFSDYSEGAIAFQPTFKYQVGTDEFNELRTPAWCDRVLWKGENVEQLHYHSHPSLLTSDHKPVSALFNVGTKEFNRELEKTCRENVMKELDDLENNYLPQVSISTHDVLFERLNYLDNGQKTITVLNDGHVLVKFNFSRKPPDQKAFQPWLNINPSSGLIPVGKRLKLVLEVQINSKTVNHWESDTIKDIVVLHLDGGKDIFITITATCVPSFFGQPITALVRKSSPIAVSNQPTTDVQLTVPKELWYIIDYLYKEGMTKNDLFHTLGEEKEIKKIRDILNTTLTGISGQRLNVYSVAETLLIFLDSFPEPVIPYDLYKQCINSSDTRSKIDIYSSMPVIHQNVFRYLCSFLMEYIEHGLSNNKPENNRDVRIICYVFSGVILKSPSSSSSPNNNPVVDETAKKVAFLQYYLTNSFDFTNNYF